jgi:hypothetical protein
MTRSGKIAEKTVTRTRRARALEKGVRLSLLVGLESVEAKTTTHVLKKPKRDRGSSSRGRPSSRTISSWNSDTEPRWIEVKGHSFFL